MFRQSKEVSRSSNSEILSPKCLFYSPLCPDDWIEAMSCKSQMAFWPHSGFLMGTMSVWSRHHCLHGRQLGLMKSPSSIPRFLEIELLGFAELDLLWRLFNARSVHKALVPSDLWIYRPNASVWTHLLLMRFYP